MGLSLYGRSDLNGTTTRDKAGERRKVERWKLAENPTATDGFVVLDFPRTGREPD
jgi:hypothetical protein